MEFSAWHIEETVGKVTEGGQEREAGIEGEIRVSPALMEGPPGSRKKARWKSRKYQHLGDSPRGRGPGERLRVLQLYRGMICVPHNLAILSVWFEDF